MKKIFIGIIIGIICTTSIFLFLGDIDIQTEIQIGEETDTKNKDSYHD